MSAKHFIGRIGFSLFAAVGSHAFGTEGLERQTKDGLLDGPVYDWWHGCSATSAGMLMGYYDRFGYNGLFYDLVPGGVAESTMVGTTDEGKGSGSASPTLVSTRAIASEDHIADFWTGYGNSGDDPLSSGRTRPGDFDSLADFMGTNQDSTGNSDGATSFWNYTGGSALDAATLYAGGPSYWETSGMYGLFEWLRFRGYEAPGSTGTARIYNQYADEYVDNENGFTFEDYKDEIDAGRPVLIHIVGHTMLGDGYDDSGGNETVYVNNTWTNVDGGEGTMQWGGTYEGEQHTGVTVVELDEAYGKPAFEGGNATFEYASDLEETVGSVFGLPENRLDSLLSIDDFDPGGDGVMTLRFYYDDQELQAAGVDDPSQLRMYWWNAQQARWIQEGTGDFFLGSPQGNGGDYGVDVEGKYAWLNSDHASLWGLAMGIPEPTTAVFLLAGVAVLALKKR